MELFQNGSWEARLRAASRGLLPALRQTLEVQLEYTPKFNGKWGRYAGVRYRDLGGLGEPEGLSDRSLDRPLPAICPGRGRLDAGSAGTGSAINGSDEHGAFAARFGGGIDVYVTDNIVVTAEHLAAPHRKPQRPESGPDRRRAPVPLLIRRLAQASSCCS